MSFWTLDRVARALAPALRGWSPIGERPLGGITTDTRALGAGDAFVALRGERFDAHDFLGEAVEKGAGALIVHDVVRAPRAGIPVFEVHDTLTALAALGTYRRRAWGKVVIAVAGSNGKTTTKELVAAAVGSEIPVFATKGNLNNQVGVPLSLLAIPDEADVAVIEIGTNHPGEVDLLREVVEPDIAIVTSIGEEHLEGLGDLAGVLREEAAVYRGVALAIAPASQPEVGAEARRLARQVVEAGLERGDVRPQAWGIGADGRVWLELEGIKATMELRGEHNLRNAMLAIAAARACGVSTTAAVSAVAGLQPLAMRGRWEQLGTLTVINDAYNANPASMREAIRLVDAVDGDRQRVLVLGSMLELGPTAATLHEEIARLALASRAQVIAGVGAFAESLGTLASGNPRLVTASDADELWPRLAPRLQQGALVLLKGSRGMRLERLVPRLAEWSGGTPSATEHSSH
jgi:UDP-N-acetylmuramoyl-tripeptide--D-alanyl-D-alanine ligase